ncbi:hypothetical protein BCR42DRAFT_388961 [Absidia repens]|uniref:Uncharacterized protein n=1 Tax=Absidia repens TaxID=90262 RepID=A0A1X2IRN5_9FUNG|nr:hypothetical protein BCR42DRAFT_388961 [Absidia repens]
MYLIFPLTGKGCTQSLKCHPVYLVHFYFLIDNHFYGGIVKLAFIRQVDMVFNKNILSVILARIMHGPFQVDPSFTIVCLLLAMRYSLWTLPFFILFGFLFSLSEQGLRHPQVCQKKDCRIKHSPVSIKKKNGLELHQLEYAIQVTAQSNLFHAVVYRYSMVYPGLTRQTKLIVPTG